MTATTITSKTLNTCAYHEGYEAIKTEVRPGRFTWKCAGCLDEQAQQEAEIAAEMGYERYLEDRGWADAAFDREMEARML